MLWNNSPYILVESEDLVYPLASLVAEPDSPDVALVFTGGGVRGHSGALPGFLLHGCLGRRSQDGLGLHETKEQSVWFVKCVTLNLLQCR